MCIAVIELRFDGSLRGKDAGNHFLERTVREHTHVGMSLIGA
ncbi:MAG: hypothetical protein R3A78_15895 [Polyangiales bacterium]